jgi:glycosyltransferase involved in cell wall biosynthesis
VSNNIGNPPIISVVTINRNMRQELEATLESVVAQTYPHLEFVVIDGGSIDGSSDLVERFASQIDYWISEPDRGIYDAMNKGVRAATGEWVIFMNAGDRFHDGDAIADVFSEDHSDTDLIYGHSTRWHAREEIARFVPAEPLAALPLRMTCSHQSLFTRRGLLLEQPFSSGLVAADYEFLVRMYIERRRFKIVDRVVAVNVSGGISDVRRLRSVTERARIAARHGLMTPWRALSYIAMGVWAGLGPHVKRALPRQITTWIMRRRMAD